MKRDKHTEICVCILQAKKSSAVVRRTASVLSKFITAVTYAPELCHITPAQA